MKRKIVMLYLIMFMGISNVFASDLPEVTDHEKVKINLFWRDGCGYCEDAINLFNELEAEYKDYFEFVTFDIAESGNMDLLNYLEETYGGSGAVPYFMIGDESIVGFSETKVFDLAFEEYQNAEYADVVSEFMSLGGSYTPETLEDACVKKGITYLNGEKKEGSDGLVIAGIFIVIIGAVGYLVLMPNKKK